MTAVTTTILTVNGPPIHDLMLNLSGMLIGATGAWIKERYVVSLQRDGKALATVTFEDQAAWETFAESTGFQP